MYARANQNVIKSLHTFPPPCGEGLRVGVVPCLPFDFGAVLTDHQTPTPNFPIAGREKLSVHPISISAKFRHFLSDTSGAAFVEMTVGISAFFLILFGIVEFSYVYYQYNAASKAMQWAARVAAVSSPVAFDLSSYTGLSNSVLPGDPMPSFDVTCQASDAVGSNVTCTGTSGLTTPSAVNFQALLFGRYPSNKTACENPIVVGATEAPGTHMGVCNYFSNVKGNNLVVRYQYTGMGYAGRPGGPVPSVTVSLRNMQYQYFFLGGFIGGSTLNMPSFATTVTGEDLNSAAPS